MSGDQQATAHRRRPWAVVTAGVLVITSLLGPVLSVGAEAQFAAPAFRAVWERTDRLVAEGRVSRPFLWGPEPIATQLERYDDGGQAGQRLVQYFDKGRLELTQPQADSTDLALLQTGALARDLALGLVQVSSARAQIFDPAFVPVAGDQDSALNPDAPRYADFSAEVLRSLAANLSGAPVIESQVGKPVTATIQAGVRGTRPATDQPQALIGAFDATSGHNIAAPFWDAFAAAGLVLDPATGAERSEPLYDWRLLTGSPLTEPAWTLVSLNGQPTLLLVQLFERRVLTYSPDAPAGWQVQMGNTGRDYYAWRYGPAPWQPPLKPMAPAEPGQPPLRFTRTPRTPTTPYQVETWVPPSINGRVTPGVGPGGTVQALHIQGFTIKDLINNTVASWLTLTGRPPVPIRLDRSPLIVAGEDRFDGMVLGLDTTSLPEGVWALTLQSYAEPERQAVLYFRVTSEPREISISVLRSGLAAIPPSEGGWPPFELGVEE